MAPELSAGLCRDFPSLYGDEFCFECHDGWEGLIRQLSTLCLLSCPELQAQQVKSKFGSLRAWFEPHTDETAALISHAETESRATCEFCGGNGQQEKINSWVWTICIECRKGKRHERG